jgi:hypothetical protein
MYLGNNAALLGCQEYFNRCAAAGSPIGGTQTPSSYDNAASFNGTNQFLSIPSNSTLTVTGTSFTFAFWAYFNSENTQIIISKRNASVTEREHQVNIFGGFVEFHVSADGSFEGRRVTSLALPALGNWNFFVCRYDSSGGGSIGISINNGAFVTTSSVGEITQTLTNPLQLGASTGPSNFYQGRLASVGFWKKALTASEVTQLWNSGAGRTYASLDSGLRTNLISWWALNQNSVTADSHTTGNNLTNSTNAVTAPATGPVANTYADPRQLIIDFAQGIDRLGLWNSMVCWPLRSSQNAASGTTAFSLGGLGQFDGALINSPSRGANGMTFLLASAQGISATVGNLTLAEQSLFAVNRVPVASGGNVMIARSSTGGTQNGMNLRKGEGSTDLSWIQQAGGTTMLSIPQFVSTDFLGFASAATTTTARMKRFPSTESADTALAFTGNLTNTDPLWIGRRSAASGTGDCTIPFASMFTRDIRSSWDQVYALYRQTLGLGLGLP